MTGSTLAMNRRLITKGETSCHISAFTDMVSLMDEVVLMAKAFADETRLRILRALFEQELCVCELCDALEATQSTLSTHLQVLREAGLVETRKQGRWVYYRMNNEKRNFADALFEIFEQTLARDRTLGSDAKRLQRRISEREEGACCRGFQGAGCNSPAPARRNSRRRAAKARL